MVFVNATFTLPGLAGLVLTLGMAVDANVLIYERLREERERGASLTLALRNGYDRAFPTILDTHLTSIFTAIVLYAVGNDQLKGFGISLTAGLVISLFTSLYVTRLLFDLWQYQGWLTKLSMFQGLTNFLHRHYIDFMRVRHIWFTITVVLTVIGLGVFLIRGPKGLNIDFVGGTAYGGQLEQPLTIDKLRDLLGRQSERLAVQSARQEGEDVRFYTVTFTDNTSVPVQLANDPAPGGTREERERVVKERAAVLPDWSVEQIFPKTVAGEENTGNASRFFTVRSTEKEANLVQVAVNRLLWQDDQWRTQAVHSVSSRGSDPGWQASKQVLLRVRQEKKTFFQAPPLADSQATEDQIKEKLATVRATRKKARVDLDAAQKDLRELLTTQQESILVALGYVD